MGGNMSQWMQVNPMNCLADERPMVRCLLNGGIWAKWKSEGENMHMGLGRYQVRLDRQARLGLCLNFSESDPCQTLPQLPNDTSAADLACEPVM